MTFRGMKRAFAFGMLAAATGCLGQDDTAWEDGVLGVVSEAVTTPSISSPSSGSTFKTTSVTFKWSAGADEYWIYIGKSSGAKDVYQSASLGQATSWVVNDLPLDGGKLYVTLQSRFGSSIKTSTKSYTAAVRKGLAVIADFADAKLEDFTGPGVKGKADVAAYLSQMQAHWKWLSRNLETAKWDIVRVKFSQKIGATAFANGGEYRAEALRLAAQVANVSDYDVNGDGLFDGVWVIGASKGQNYGYMDGGTSREAAGYVFVDAQHGGSFVNQAYGNFNHEFGHCVKHLADLYGDYSTIGAISLMSDSWALPANDFTSYERLLFGWLKPQRITQTTRNITLGSANAGMSAVLIPTSRAAEYFLVEYRVTPSSGYGSAGNKIDGLLVYHVLQNSSQGQTTPLLKVEPADGVIAAMSTTPEPTDALYPGNPLMKSPFQARSYIGGQPVFRIENLSRVVSPPGMKFDAVVQSPTMPGSNLLSDPSVEQGSGATPSGWTTSAWNSTSTLKWESSVKRTGSRSLSIDSPSENDAEWRRSATGLTVGKPYLLCGWLKGQAILPSGGSDTGGTVAFTETWLHALGGFGTFDWQQACVPYQAEQTSALVACRLGYWSNTASGKLWCDDFSLELLTPTF